MPPYSQDSYHAKCPGAEQDQDFSLILEDFYNHFISKQF